MRQGNDNSTNAHYNLVLLTLCYMLVSLLIMCGRWCSAGTTQYTVVFGSLSSEFDIGVIAHTRTNAATETVIEIWKSMAWKQIMAITKR